MTTFARPKKRELRWLNATPDLFVPTMGVLAPLHVGHSDDDTSKEAAIAIAPVAGHKRLTVLRFFDEQGARGATTDEAEIALSMKHQTCSARVNELAKLCMIERTDERRTTSSGRPASVYRITVKGRDEVRSHEGV
jgi:hypothetical protein